MTNSLIRLSMAWVKVTIIAIDEMMILIQYESEDDIHCDFDQV